MLKNKIKFIIIAILIIICSATIIISRYKFETNNNSDYDDAFLPSIAIKSCFIDTKGYELDYQNINAKAFYNVSYYFINNSNFDVSVTLFIAVNGLPRSYNIDNLDYNPMVKLFSFQLQKGESLKTDINLDDLIDTGFEYMKNYMDVVAIVRGLNLPENSITENVSFACDSKYIIDNPGSNLHQNILLDKFDNSSSNFDVDFNANTSYCFLNGELKQNELFQSDYLPKKFYGVFSEQANRENYSIYIFEDSHIADISNNCLPIKITKEQVIVKEFKINEYNNGDIYCLMIPTTSAESTMHYFNVSKIIE